MHDANAMSSGESVGDLHGELEAIRNGQKTFSYDVIECLAAHELHDNGVATVVNAGQNVMNGDDIGVIQG